jgi:hypothetical protein
MWEHNAPRMTDKRMVGRDVWLAGDDVERGAEDLLLVQSSDKGGIIDDRTLGGGRPPLRSKTSTA